MFKYSLFTQSKRKKIRGSKYVMKCIRILKRNSKFALPFKEKGASTKLSGCGEIGRHARLRI